MSEQPIIKVQDLYKTYRAGDVDVNVCCRERICRWKRASLFPS